MTIHGQLTAADHAEARRLGLLPCAVIMALNLFGLVTVSFSSLFTHQPPEGWEYLRYVPALLFGLIVLLCLAQLLFFHLSTLPPRSEKIFQAIDYLHAPRDLEILPGGLKISSPLLNVSLGWKNAFRYYRLGPHVIVVYQSGSHFQIFPKRWFTPDQLTEFQAHLQTALGPPRSKWL